MIDFAMASWEEACDYAIKNWTDLDQHEFMEIDGNPKISDFMKLAPTRFE